MSEIIVGILSVLGVLVIYKLFRSGGKEFQPKLSHRERAKLEQSIDIKPVEKKKQAANETTPAPMVTSFPQKDLKDEIVRFKSFFDIENDKLTKTIRKGIDKFTASDFKGALKEFSTAVDIKPAEPVAYYCRAVTKLRLRNYESSVPDFTESIRLQMGEVNCLYYRGLAKYHSKDFSGATLDLTSFLKAVPEFAEAYYILGLVYKDSGKPEDAIENFSLAVANNDRHEAAYFERALIKNKTGDRKGCCEDFRKAFDLGHLEAYHYIKELCGDTA